MLAGMGIGRFGTPDAAVEAMVRPAELIPVSKDRARVYDELFALYRDVYPTLKQLNYRIMRAS